MIQQPEFGQRLRDLRQEKSVSQRDLAGGSVTPSYISLLESGRRIPTLDVVVHLAEALGVPISALLGHELHDVGRRDTVEESLLLAEALTLNAADPRDFDRAADTLSAALEEARADNNTARVLEVGIRLQYVLTALDRREARVALLRELVDLPGANKSVDLQVVLRTDLAAALRDSGDMSGARTTANDALDRITGSTLVGTSQHVKLLGVVVSILVEQGDNERVDRAVTELLNVAEHGDSPGLTGRAHWVATMAYASLGRNNEARAHLTAAHNHLASPILPLREWMRFCRTSASVLIEVNGDLEEIAPWLQSADTTATALGIPSEQKRVAALHARYQFTAGDYETALATATSVLADTSGLIVQEVLRLRILRATALGRTGDTTTGVAELRQLAAECEEREEYQLGMQVWRQIDELQAGTHTNRPVTSG
jgi:transcriptional regulator with XRE-family HTH domain